MSSQCLFLVHVLCSLQSPGLHFTLESMAAIPGGYFTSLYRLCSDVLTQLENVFFFFFFFVYVQLWILGRATHKSWSLHFSVAAMLAPPSYLVLPCQLSIEWMWRCGDAVSYFQPAAVSGSSVVAELCVYECVALPLVNCVLMTEEKDAYILWS